MEDGVEQSAMVDMVTEAAATTAATSAAPTAATGRREVIIYKGLSYMTSIVLVCKFREFLLLLDIIYASPKTTK